MLQAIREAITRDRLTKAIQNPRLLLRFLSAQGKDGPAVWAAEKYAAVRYGDGTNALTQDWDNLIILDACRYDTFADLHSLPGELERRRSIGSATLGWLRKAIGEREFHDTVYVTANPRLSRYEDQFHEVIAAWESDWDEELKVVPPETLADRTVDAAKRHPHKRIVAHFMQPHIPFLGEFGRSEIGVYDGTTKGVNRAAGNEYSANTEPYTLLRDGHLDTTDVVRAYRENLRVALPAVERLLNELRGKSVVTADHGEMFGGVGWPLPVRVYGHRLRTPTNGLLEVPWLEYTNGGRRDITSEPSKRSTRDVADEKIEERLKHLGYQ